MICFGYLARFYVWSNLKTPPATSLTCSYLKWQEGQSSENDRLTEIRLNTASDLVLYEQIRTNTQKTCSTRPVPAKAMHSSPSPLEEKSEFGTFLDGLHSPCSTKSSYGSSPFLYFRYPKLKIRQTYLKWPHVLEAVISHWLLLIGWCDPEEYLLVFCFLVLICVNIKTFSQAI